MQPSNDHLNVFAGRKNPRVEVENRKKNQWKYEGAFKLHAIYVRREERMH
jgi:hypothetical protein